MRRSVSTTALLIAMSSSTAHASSSAAFAALDGQSSRACIVASGLRHATAGPAVRFSDAFMMDARTVTGVYAQPHMKGASGSFLCLYNRRTRRAEAEESFLTAKAPQPGAGIVQRGVWWRAADVVGRGVEGGDVTLMFGGDGKVTGKSGCNNYSMSYQLTGTTLKMYPPMIGTRMMCPPAVMDEEARFRKTLGEAISAAVSPDGALVLTGPAGQTLRLVRGSPKPRAN